MKHVFLVSLLVAGALIAAPKANAKVLSCDGCTDQEMWDLAQQELLSVSGYNSLHLPAYVTNFGNGTVRKYAYQNNVGPDFDWEIDGFEAWIVEVPVDATVRQLVSDIDAIGPGPVTLAALPYSAWDVVSNVGKDDEVREYLEGTFTGFRAQVNDYVSAVNPFPGFHPTEITYSIVLNFSDGTKATYDYKPSIGEWVRRPDSARDSHGNLIPETVDDYTNDGGIGEYDFPTPMDRELYNFIDRARQMGIQVGAPTGSGGGRVRIACVKAGSSTVCEIVVIN